MSTLKKLEGLSADIVRLEKSDLFQSVAGGSIGVSYGIHEECLCGMSGEFPVDFGPEDRVPHPEFAKRCAAPDTGTDPMGSDPVVGPAGND